MDRTDYPHRPLHILPKGFQRIRYYGLQATCTLKQVRDRLLTVLQVLLGVQLLAGLVLLAQGGRPAILHYLYGAVFPALVIGVCHVFTRGLEKPPYHVFFTIGSFFVFGLTARALMTGLGIG